ncbi:MAG: ABC-F family ATP-binding cassette domain-containing protein, partial [Chitinophagaceae bacterium]|nr:ABC-F family ATP-binding cassette domain-containing protein [Anaerolineae bacterium]
MLTVSNITKTFPGMDSPILKNITFTVNAGERVGLIGPNGSGKSTLINILIGETLPDSGGIIFNPPNIRIGYLAQGLIAVDDASVRDILFPQAASLNAIQAELDCLVDRLTHEDSPTLLAAYNDALDRLAALGY